MSDTPNIIIYKPDLDEHATEIEEIYSNFKELKNRTERQDRVYRAFKLIRQALISKACTIKDIELVIIYNTSDDASLTGLNQTIRNRLDALQIEYVLDY